MKKQFLSLENIRAYQIAYPLSNRVWEIILSWDSFAKWTVGKQWVESTDSISANLAEGFGRFHKKDKIRFYRYSQGSLLESIDWTRKAKHRGLLSETEFEELFVAFNELPIAINYLIRYTNEKLKF